jgi:hypothetical protein
MSSANKQAEAVTAEQALASAAQGQEKKGLSRIAEVQASARAHLSRLLNASPAVICCRLLPDDDFQPTFVSDSVTRPFGCTNRSIGHV